MAISNANAAKINKMNRAAANVTLGTAFQTAQTDIAALQVGSVITAGSLTVATAQSAASAVTIDTGLGASYLGQIFQITRSGSLLNTASASVFKVVNNSGSIVITGSGAGVVVTGDKYFWVAF